MDVALVNPFVESTLHILDTTAAVKAKPDPPFLKTDIRPLADISGILEITGDLAGSAAVSFTECSILSIVSAMFGEKMTRINEEIIDAVGEISNMVAGHVTTKLAEQGKKVKVKFVRVSTGPDQPVIHTDSGSPVLALPFKTTMGKVVIEVCYSQ